MAVIVDVIGGLMTVCQKPDVSSEIIEEFVTDYKNGRLEMTPLPASCQVQLIIFFFQRFGKRFFFKTSFEFFQELCVVNDKVLLLVPFELYNSNYSEITG